MKRKIIVHIIHKLDTGGVGVAVKSSVDFLNEEFDFWVVSVQKDEVGFTNDIKRQDRLKSFNMYSIFMPVNLIRFCWFMIRVRPDIVLVSLWKSLATVSVVRLLKPRIRIVPIMHHSSFFHFFDSFFHRRAFKVSNTILADSGSSSNLVKQEFPDKDVRVISFMIDRTDITKSPKAITGRNMFIFIGRITHVKRIDRAIELIELLKDKGLNVKLDIYGPDEGLQADLQEQLEKSGLVEQISFKGLVPHAQLNKLLQEYDFSILTSDTEGMAMAVVEAMQHGLIPVVTQTGEMQHYVKHMQNGIIIPPPFDDLGPTADAVKKVIDSPSLKQELSDNAFQVFQNRLIYREEIQQVLHSLLGKEA